MKTFTAARQSNDYIAPLPTSAATATATATSPMTVRSAQSQTQMRGLQTRRDRADAFRQRKLSDVHAAFSLKRGRLDSSMASMYKLSVDDQRILQREEWKLLNALKCYDGNKAVIIDAIRKATVEVLCNFMIFLLRLFV